MKTIITNAITCHLRSTGLMLVALIAGLVIPPASRAAQNAIGSLLCTQYSIPVTLSPDDPTVYHIVGWLYSQGSAAGKTVQIVLHGGTYDHNYFSFPYQPWNYSYVDYITSAGYAALDIDRIGSGLSDHPTPEEVTFVSGAYTIHQIVQGLRSGTLTGSQFNKVMLVGHSLGSAISLVEAGTYQDVDAVILSGFASAINQTGYNEILAGLEEANSEPEFANLPNGYLILKPSVRAELFYNAQDADPDVIALDQILHQTATDGEMGQAVTVFTTNTYSSQVNAPVLIANGSDDGLFAGSGMPFNGADPSSIKAYETPFFPLVPSLSVFVLQNSGHDVNLHLNAMDWFEAARAWSDQYVGRQ
jgi:pimeloyl-ACP methyl ester carboxylesterase